jgi:predicted RNA binding protein YcfA (HicA-like mRNA interferase family)
MRLPRDISGAELAHLVKRYGYVITRQTGSHIRLTTTLPHEHHITIPHHNPLRIGTLAAICADIAHHQGYSKDRIIQELFE